MVIEMQKKMFGQKKLRLNANLGATIKRVTEVLLPASRESIPLDMLASDCLPYQASKTYRKIVSEYDCRRAQITSEAQQALRRL